MADQQIETTKEKNPKVRKILVRIIVLLVILLLDFWYSHVNVKQYLYERRIDTRDWSGTSINNEWEFTESFIEEDKAIDGFFIRISCGGDVANVSDAALTYTVRDENGNDLRKGFLPASEVKNAKFNKLELDKEIPDTQGKRYILVIKGRGMHARNVLSINYTQMIEGSKSKMVVDGKEIKGQAIVCRSYNHRFNLETFIVALGFIGFIAFFMKLLGKLFAR